MIISFTDGQAFVFSVKKNVWRYLVDFNYRIVDDGLAANGCLYWAAGKNNTAADPILRLDLSDDKDIFREVLPPPSFNQPIEELRLFLKGNPVCVLRENDQSLWEMNDEKGNGQTWKKLMTIPEFQNQDHHFQFGEFGIGHHFQFGEFGIDHHFQFGDHQLYPRCFTKGGKILFTVGSKKFVLFNPKELIYEEFDVCGLEYGPFNKIVAYNESLISPVSEIVRGMDARD